jgi:molybdopterin-guanine dinucleotide biosynthesis protein B
MPEEALVAVKPVTIEVPPQEMPGYRGTRVECAECGEGINFSREVERGGRVLCIPCSQEDLHSNDRNSAGTTANPKILLIVGSKKVGKTTLIERLIPELSRRGYRVGTVKHHHSDYPISVDTAGTDSWRHRQAGATGVALVTPTDIALFRHGESSVSLDDIVAGLGATDIVLVEGFHNEPRAKIEVRSARTDGALCAKDVNLVAVVAPEAHAASVPTLTPGNIQPIADFIEREILARR